MVRIYISTFTVERIYYYTSYYYTRLYTYIPSYNTIPDTSISQRNRNFKNTHSTLTSPEALQQPNANRSTLTHTGDKFWLKQAHRHISVDCHIFKHIQQTQSPLDAGLITSESCKIHTKSILLSTKHNLSRPIHARTSRPHLPKLKKIK